MLTEKEKRDLVLSTFRSGHTTTSIVKMLKGSVGRSTVFRHIQEFKSTGKTSRKIHKREKTVCTAERKKRIREKVRRNPARSMRQLAKEENVPKTTMWHLVRKELGMFPFKKRRRQLLSEATKFKRLQRGRDLLCQLQQSTLPPILWTDEKLFTVQAVHNHQNDRVLAGRKEDIPVELRTAFRRQKPPSVMVWAGVTTDGRKTPLIFMEEGVKVDQAVYLDLLSEVVLPWVKEEYGDTPLLFQQDEAPSHTAKIVQEWCKDMFSHFWSKSEWPPSSPDLTPMDFGIWSILESRACTKSVPTVDTLKSNLIKSWAEISTDEVIAITSSTVKRFKAVVAAKGGYFEK